MVIRSSGVDVDKYDLSNIDPERSLHWKETFNVRSRESVVLMVTARLIKSKGVMDFLEAAKILSNSDVKCKFILIAPSEKNTHDEINPKVFEECNLDNFVYYKEFIDDIHNMISIADIIVLPSYYREGVPRILLEGMALSKPLITTNSVGCRETVRHNVNGFLIDPKNSHQLAENIQNLIQNSDLAEAFGVNSRRMAREEFSDTIVSKQVISELYYFPEEE